MKYIITTALLLVTGFIFHPEIAALVSGNGKKDGKLKFDKTVNHTGSDVVIQQKWELPASLLEVSGIAYMGRNRFACVQDELGIIYIYNTSSSAIEKEIPFSGPGDFEGITLNGNTAYIVRSDAVLFEVDMMSGKTREYNTHFTAGKNVESIFYQAGKNRLLIAAKEPDRDDANLKGIFAFDLQTKNIKAQPVTVINLDNDLLDSKAGGKKKKKFMPSAIAVHPLNNDLYILDGPKSRLMVTESNGKIKQVYALGKDFYKPEGISFGPGGDLYISNEGKKEPGNILKVEIPL